MRLKRELPVIRRAEVDRRQGHYDGIASVLMGALLLAVCVTLAVAAGVI